MTAIQLTSTTAPAVKSIELKPETVVDISAATIQGKAQAFAVKAANDTGFNESVAEFTAASILLKRTAVAMLFKLEALYTSAELDAAPVPGSKGGNNPDKFQVPEKNAKGNLVNKPGSFWMTVCINTPVGAEFRAKLDGISKAKRQAADAPKEYAAMGDAQLDDEEAYYDTKLGGYLTTIQRAINLRNQMKRGKESPKVNVEFNTIEVILQDKSSVRQMVKGPRCITVQDKGSPGNIKAMTVTSFLGLDFDAAEKLGGTWAQVIASGGTGAQDPDEDEDKPFNVDAFEIAMARTASFFEDTAKVAALRKRLNPKDPAEAYDFVLTLGNLHLELVNLWDNFGLKIKYERADAIKNAPPVSQGNVPATATA